MTVARRGLALTITLLFLGCTEVSAPTVSRVVLDRHAATLWAGDVLATSVSVFKTDGAVVPNPPVTYTSSNSPVASVDSTGKVYAHVAGQAMISAAVGSITDTLALTVLWPPVTDVVFTHDSLVMSVGDTVLIGVFVIDANGNHAIHATVTYASSAPGIAIGGEGPVYPGTNITGGARIAAVGEGRARITVTAERISDSLPVTVRPR